MRISDWSSDVCSSDLIPKVSAKVLTARLRALEAKGVVIREVKPTSPPSVEYSLTDLGQQLVPAINAIAEVGHKLRERNGARSECSRSEEHTSELQSLMRISYSVFDSQNTRFMYI